MRLLVANRGEIAVRILRTAKELGWETVAVYSDADRLAPHVRLADRAVRLGPAPAAESYLRAGAIITAALDTSCDAVHPGYGFLSEDAAFARACEDAGLAFAGPSPEHLEVFGSKHTAREAAIAAGVPLLAGTGLLSDVDEALARAEDIGYPVMLKATGGGGGIGMRACASPDELRAAWDTVQSIAAKSFANSGVFLERLVRHARHVEVQVFGDGYGEVLELGTRDCSLQRRNQKVVEECPAPDLPDAVRRQLVDSAVALCSSVRYRSAGTVEYVYDAERGEAAFLEVNTRLQVEHPVTEAVYGVDLVAWMLRLAQGDRGMFRAVPVARGHAVEARVYAEDPSAGHRPSAGLVTRVTLPEDTRVDTWVEPGTTVTTHYDPLLAKVICTGADRADALASLRTALAATRVDGVRTNLGQLRSAAADPAFAAATHDTSTLDDVEDAEPRIDVVRGGTMTTVQDWPGRTGFWHVGVPPSGPMDDLSLRLGNLALGNPEGAPGLECTVDGVTLRFSHATEVCVTGAPTTVLVDGAEVPLWTPVEVPAGATLDVRACTAGLRSYVLVRGGVDVPGFLGSAATFTLGRFGGHGGRALAAGDVLQPGTAPGGSRWSARSPTGPSSLHTGRSARSKARTRRRSSSPRKTSTRSTPPTGRCTSTRRAPASGSSGRGRSGPGRTAARRACTRRTSTTRRTRSAPSTTPATCRSCSARTGPASAGSSARRRSPPASGGSSGSCARATPCGSCRSTATTRRRCGRGPRRRSSRAGPAATTAGCSGGCPLRTTSRR